MRTPPVVTLLALLAAPAASFAGLTPGQLCEKTAGDTLRSCVKKASKLAQKCYQTASAACPDTDPKLVKEMARIGGKVLPKCPDPATVQAASYGPVLTPAGLVERLASACTRAVASLAARSVGGPHGAAYGSASAGDRKCLDGAWKEGQGLIDYAMKQQSTCIRNAGAGRPCDAAGVAAKIAAREARSVAKIGGRCPTPLASLVATDAAVYASRALAQSRCLVATAHGVTTPLALDCGPRAAVPVPARGVAVKVVLPHAVFGSRCGNGSDYAFDMRLAPVGFPVENVVVHMSGGGFCADGPSCAARSPDLFEAMSDTLPNGGMMSSTQATNPFQNWTKVGLPYCTQDLHLGGGVPTAYPEMTVHRYGALNVRAALGYVRDVIWAVMDADDPQGYRADRPRMVFAGSSAGGYGAAYNYHWVLDDLGWIHSTSVPDAALAMDNGTPLGVIAIGAVTLPATYPGWNTLPFLPPYCKDPSCAEIFDNLELATSPRLLGTPEQRMLNVSNQIDNTQRNTTLFPSNGAFVNALRANYCSVQGTPGIFSWIRGVHTHIHGELNQADWNTGTAAGVLLRDWVGGAMSNPAGLVDAVETGTVDANVSGVLPFPCALGSPSGAFL
ncbi:MAG: hypothetical protein KIT14_04840 [bacterium]|nr:hypothetical protein [bacterium]